MKRGALTLAQFWTFSRKIVAVGRNYAEHARELGNEVPTTPVLFLKPPSSFITAGSSIEVPPNVKEVHHEGGLLARNHL